MSKTYKVALRCSNCDNEEFTIRIPVGQKAEKFISDNVIDGECSYCGCHPHFSIAYHYRNRMGDH